VYYNTVDALIIQIPGISSGGSSADIHALQQPHH
jgi:hypothetical protein